MGKFGIEAGADGKQSTDQPECFSEGGGRRVGAEVKRPVFLDLPDNAQCGERFFHRELEAGIVLVIPQLDVVPGSVFLDEMVLQDESLLLRVGEDGLDLGDFSRHQQGLRVFPRLLLEVGTDPMLDVPCFPYVKNPTLAVFEKIDAWMGGEMIDPLF
jgi:hypothetical protein